jgi:hypothetical protein
VFLGADKRVQKWPWGNVWVNTRSERRDRIGEVEQAYLTSAGGDVTGGDAKLAAEHDSEPG